MVRHAAPRLLRYAILAAVTLLLVACSGLGAPPPAPTAAPETPTPPPTVPVETPLPEPRCAVGRLTVGDIASVAVEWSAGVQGALERAREWRGDARLVGLQVGCQPLEPAFRWEGTFYSDTAQAFFASDTRQTTPAEVDPAAVPNLPLERIDFGELHRALARAGYGDRSLLSPTSGLTVRLNAPTDPFGPPGTPADVVYHVAIDERGETRDLFVSAANWTIHSYQDRG
jgi:hypothetical protein